MKYFILIIVFFTINFIEILSWGHDNVIDQNELEKNKNSTREHFKKGLKQHTMKVGIRLKNSQNDEVEILSLISDNNKLSLKYYKNEHKVIFHIYMDIQNKTSLWEIQYPNINLEVGGWHYLVYRFGKLYFKLWIDCELRRSKNSDLKTLININDNILKVFGNNISLKHGDNDDIDYNQQISFIDHPSLDYSFSDRSTCKHSFNLTNSQIRINDNDTEGTFYPLDQFQDVLTKYTSPGVYYEIKTSTLRDVSEFFEDGLDKDHSFEMTYRIKEFPASNYSYYFIMLKSGAESKLSFALNGKRNILKISSNSHSNNDLSNYDTEYWADQIYNNDWHTIKYTLENGIFTLWIDGEIMEDYLGFKHVDLKYKGYDTEYIWFDTAMLILEPKSGLHNEPILNIRHMKYYGNAITTNNTELSLVAEKTEESGYFNKFLKVIGRSWF